MRLSSAYLALLVSLVVPAVAHADDLITITAGPDTLSFVTSSNPTPFASVSGVGFELLNVPVQFDGVATVDTFTFYTDGLGGGFSDSFLSPFSAQLFTGDASDPTFALGVYDLSFEELGGPVDGSITITNAPNVGATPEPSSLVLLGTGALALAGGIRRRLR